MINWSSLPLTKQYYFTIDNDVACSKLHATGLMSNSNITRENRRLNKHNHAPMF